MNIRQTCVTKCVIFVVQHDMLDLSFPLYRLVDNVEMQT